MACFATSFENSIDQGQLNVERRYMFREKAHYLTGILIEARFVEKIQNLQNKKKLAFQINVIKDHMEI